MARLILLDAGVIGLLCSSPALPSVQACGEWLVRQGRAGVQVRICDLSDFEVRRELLRIGATAKISRLDQFGETLGTVAVNAPAWLRAAEFWALVRRAGMPTADPKALDGDVVLAGVAATLGEPGDEVVIATDNVKHFGRFPGIDARPWGAIT